MNILLTGGSGFLGRHLVSSLKENGHRAYHLVRKPGEYADEILWDFQSLLPANVPQCDIVVHLAAYVHFAEDFKEEQYRVNTLSMIPLAEYAKKYNIPVIFASMAGVHGAASLIEAASPIKPVNHYGVSKFLAEEILKSSSVKFTILRIGGMYGLDGPSHLGLNVALNNAFYKNESPVLSGSGKAKRNYLCVLDAVEWINGLLEKYKENKAKKSEVLYLASDEELTIKQYLTLLTQNLVPGSKLVEKEGKEAADSIIRPSPRPFKLRTFQEYLSFLKEKQSSLTGK
jgi:UDP-glucose 4-epimerase